MQKHYRYTFTVESKYKFYDYAVKYNSDIKHLKIPVTFDIIRFEIY